MLATMDDVQYNEHRLAEKAQRILDCRQSLQELKENKAQLYKQKPTCKKGQLTYEESIEFGQKIDRYEEELHHLEIKILKLKRQLSALELQAQKLMPVSGVKIKVSRYSDEGRSGQTYCIQQKQSIEQSDPESVIQIKKI